MKFLRYYLILLLHLPLFAAEKQSHLADGWYPHDPAKLAQALAEHDTNAASSYDAAVNPTAVKALIAPHAGISYSGDIAAAVYRLANPQTRRVIILAPDHSGKTNGIALPPFNHYAIANGTLKVDTLFVKKLQRHPIFSYQETAFAPEHSLEMQLPFIARYMPGAKIVPLIVGPIRCMQADDVATILKKHIDKQTLVVVSTDFVHYGTRFNFAPFTDHQQLRTRHLNSQAIELIEQQRCGPFEHFMQQSHATICGSNPLKVLLALLHANAFGAVEPRLIAYGSSSDTATDDFVTYVGMIFTTQKVATLPINEQLTQQEKRNLFGQAQNTLTHMLEPNFDEQLYYPIRSFGVTRNLGAFTTLRTQDGSLRGCIGRILASDPLYKTIATVTQDTALRDSRFNPVTQQEIPGLSLKLSVLSKPKKIKSYTGIELGKHGIILKGNGRSAVFLPEVATEQKWNIDQTLSQLAQKAGLDKDAWKLKDTEFQVFSTVDIPASKNPA